MFFFFFIRNRYGEALANYEKGLDMASLDRIYLSESSRAEHERLCKFGKARTNIKMGNFKKGVSFASLSQPNCYVL